MGRISYELCVLTQLCDGRCHGNFLWGGVGVCTSHAGRSHQLQRHRFPAEIIAHAVWLGTVSSLPAGRVLLKPKGVVGLITPWNYPLSNPAQKIAGALVTGNVVVWRPSSICSQSSALLAALLARAGLPEPVLATIYETSSDLARQLVADDRVNAISFTGSTMVGRQIRATVLGRGGSVQCEMGGKNAAVVLSDSDLRHAAERIAYGAFSFAGQKCTAVSRVYVEGGVMGEFLSLLAEATSELVVGPADHPDTFVGPVISAAKKRDLVDICESARSRGIRALAIDQKTVGIATDSSMLAPVIFTDVPHDDDLMKTEFFGPVLAIAAVGSLAEAIRRVNGNEYGLAACIFTTDRDKARHFAGSVDVGTVKINDSTPGLSIGLPAGGWKASGAGIGELGDESIRFFTRSTAVIG